MKKVPYSSVSYVFSREIEPALTIKPGEGVVFETLDARSARSIPSQGYSSPLPQPLERSNPVTGPVYVDGAEPGDVLSIKIESIKLMEWGYVSAKPTVGVLKDWIKEPITRAVRVHGGMVFFREGLTFPTRPMVGTVGVAPAEGGVHTIHPGVHGGNMDCNDITVGSTVYLPVFVEGALLALGDVHAFMGDGETSGGGLDISADVEAEIDVLRGVSLGRPLVETRDHIVYTYNATDLKIAVRGVVEEAVKHLSCRLKLPLEEAIILVSVAGDVMLCQACDSPIDVVTRLKIPKAVFPKDTWFL
ncbi:MAG: acetamidase/formamidase family protein [Candidatus Bathyarchaeia archaeon]